MPARGHSDDGTCRRLVNEGYTNPPGADVLPGVGTTANALHDVVRRRENIGDFLLSEAPEAKAVACVPREGEGGCARAA